MRSGFEMLVFAARTYVVSLVFGAGAACFATWAMDDLVENRRAAAILMRGEVRPRFLGRSWLVARSIAGAGRPVLAALGSLAVATCYFLAISVPLGIASQGHLPDRLIVPLSGALGLALSCVSLAYVGSGGRQAGPIFPVLDVRPWVVDNQVRIRVAAAVVRLVLVDEMIVLFALLAFVAAAAHVTSGPDGELANPIELLYLAGAALMVVLAWLLRRLLPWTVPNLAALRLLMQTTDRPAGAPVRDALTDLCRLVDRHAVVASRKDAAVRAQSPRAVVLRSVAGNLRTFLSNKISVGVRLEDVRTDLIMVAAFLCHPTSMATFDTLASRMQAFTGDGSPHDDYRSEAPGRFVVVMNRLLTGLERTHQGFMRMLAILAVLTVLTLLATGVIKAPDIIKIVKL